MRQFYDIHCLCNSPKIKLTEKAAGSTCAASWMDTKSRKRGGRGRLASPLWGIMAQSWSSCCWLTGTFETDPFTQNKVWSREWAEEAEQKARLGRTAWRWLSIQQQEGEGGRTAAFKVDKSHKGPPYGRRDIICSGVTERKTEQPIRVQFWTSALPGNKNWILIGCCGGTLPGLPDRRWRCNWLYKPFLILYSERISYLFYKPLLCKVKRCF